MPKQNNPKTKPKKNKAKAPASTVARNKTIAKETKITKRKYSWLPSWLDKNNKAVRYGLIPLLIYSLIFIVYTWPWATEFSSKFYLDSGDGFQNVWNFWWVNHSVAEYGTNPYFTNMLHWPHGTSLLPQTMNIFNGLVAIPLINVLGFSLVQAVNTMVVFSFIFAGLSMFWLVQKIVKSYWPAIIAGGLYTFSSFHFAHAQGHMQLVSLEFIPLFLLAYMLLLEEKKYRYAFGAAISLFLVLLCDYYYLFWCIMLGAMWLGWKIWKKEITINKQTIRVMAAFAAMSLVLIGPLVFSLLHLNKVDPLTGSHDPSQFAMDPLSAIIPGGSWRWRSLTEGYWSNLEYFAETSMFFGFALTTLLVVAFVKQFVAKKRLVVPGWINFWWIVFFVFAILSLGPRPSTFGKTLYAIPLPYALLEKVFPTLEISGMPIRWILVALIAAIIIVAYALSQLDTSSRKGKLIMLAFVLVSVVDLWPARLPHTDTAVRPYVHFLKENARGAIIDNGALSGAEQLYHQTIHEQPIAFGYVTRLPESIATKDFLIFAALEEGRLNELCQDYRIRYITVPTSRPIVTSFPLIYNDGDTLIYDVKNSDNCVL